MLLGGPSRIFVVDCKETKQFYENNNTALQEYHRCIQQQLTINIILSFCLFSFLVTKTSNGKN